MISLRKLSLASVAMMALLIGIVTTAKADTITFTYTVTGNANATQNGSVLSFNFIQSTTPNTILGLLTVNPQGTGFDFGKVNPDGTISGAETATYTFSALDKFVGGGTEFVTLPNAQGISTFFGTSLITSGTGKFAGATGQTSYTGTFNTVTGAVTFTETVTISAPGLTAPVPEPATLLLFGTGLVATAARFRRKKNRT